MQKIQIRTMCGRHTPKLTKYKFTFPQISHLSSNRRVRNLTFYFQFTTPARKLTHRTKFEHAERHEFRKRHVSLPPWAREMPKSYPERHEFQKRDNSSLPWARESLNPTVKYTNFAHKLHSFTPAKMPRKVFIFPEFRTLFEMHSLTPSTLTKQQLGNT